MKIVPLQIEGLSNEQNQSTSDRLLSILKSWEGTPHMDGQQSKGKGVDCVRFVAAVLDEMGGTKTPIRHFPRDTAFHHREKAIAGMRLFIKQFDGYHVQDTEELQPGDVLITGPVSGGPGHAIIVGPDGLWQAGSNSVIWCGLDAIHTTLYKYKATMRVKDRKGWAL